MKRAIFMLLLGAQLAFANSEPPLPSWNARDRKKMIGDGWIAGGSLLTREALLPEDSAAEPPLYLEAPTAEELAVSPEDENEVSEEYLAAYFAEKPDGRKVRDRAAQMQPEESLERLPVVDLKLGPFIREIIKPLETQNLEH